MKRLLGILLAGMCIISQAAFAQSGPSLVFEQIRVDGIGQTLTISGTLRQTPLPDTVFLLVKDAAEEINPANVRAHVVHALGLAVDAQTGAFTCTLNMVGAQQQRVYDAVLGNVSVGVSQSQRQLTVYLPSVGEAQQALAAMNLAGGDTIASVIAAYVLPDKSALGVYHKALYHSDKDSVHKALLEKRAALGGSFAAISDFHQAWAQIMAHQQALLDILSAVNSATRESLTDVIETYNPILGLDLTDYKYYGPIVVNKKLLSVTYTSIGAFETAFYQKVREVKEEAARGGGGTGTPTGGGSRTAVHMVPSEAAAPPASAVFKDIASYAWAQESILHLHELGVISGDGHGNFMPEKEVTREEFIKMIILAFGIAHSAGQEGFTDMERGAWYEPYLLTAKERGISQGLPDGSFGVGASISREEMMTIAHRAAQTMNITFGQIRSVQFSDFGDVAHYAAEAVRILANSGIAEGNGDGAFAPKNSATRAEAAKILSKIIMQSK